MYEIILGRGSTVPERLRGEGVHGTKKVERWSIASERVRNTAL
jgi:hypothetical protein